MTRDIRLQSCAHIGNIGLFAARVDHQKQMIPRLANIRSSSDPRPALVNSPYRCRPRPAQHIHRDQAFKRQRRPRSAAQDHLPHMADIKKPGLPRGSADVLASPPSDIAQASHSPQTAPFWPQFDMQVIERVAVIFGHRILLLLTGNHLLETTGIL